MLSNLEALKTPSQCIQEITENPWRAGIFQLSDPVAKFEPDRWGPVMIVNRDRMRRNRGCLCDTAGQKSGRRDKSHELAPAIEYRSPSLLCLARW